MKNHKKASVVDYSYNSVGYYDYYNDREARIYKFKVVIKKIVLFVVLVGIMGVMTYFYIYSNSTASTQPAQNTEVNSVEK